MDTLSYREQLNLIVSKLEEFNKLNNDIKRYTIFNTFNMNYVIEENILYFEIVNTDDQSEAFTELTNDKSVSIDILNKQEINWLIKTVNRFIEKSKESMKKARELAKPHVGILVYDEFSDSYYLNPVTGPILLKSKEIQKEITSIRIDIFNIFIRLKYALLDSYEDAETIGENQTQILKRIYNLVEELKEDEKKLKKIQGIPRYIVQLVEQPNQVTFTSFMTVDMFDNDSQIKNKFNKINVNISLDKSNEVDRLLNLLKKDKKVSTEMVNLARSLISKTEPRLYKQDSKTKLWILTSEGKQTMHDLNIVDFINNDISELNFDLN